MLVSGSVIPGILDHPKIRKGIMHNVSQFDLAWRGGWREDGPMGTFLSVGTSSVHYVFGVLWKALPHRPKTTNLILYNYMR